MRTKVRIKLNLVHLPLHQTWFHIIKPDHLDMNMTLTFNNWFCRAVNNIAVIIEMKPVFTVFPQTATTAHTQKSVDH